MSYSKALRVAEEVTATYETHGLSQLGALNAAINSPNLLMPKIVNRFKTQILASLSAYLISMTGKIRVSAEDQVNKALSDVAKDLGITSKETFNAVVLEEVGSVVEGLILDAIAKITNQAISDKRSVLRFQQRFALDVHRYAYSKGIAESSAVVAVRARSKLPEMEFIDRAAKRWKGADFVYVVTLSIMMKIYNQVYMQGIIAGGFDTAKIKYPELSHPNYGKEISVSGKNELIPSYIDVEKDIFHPRSLATLVANITATSL